VWISTSTFLAACGIAVALCIAPPAFGSNLFFETDNGDDERKIYRAGANGENAAPILDGYVSRPTLSPDGTRLAFIEEDTEPFDRDTRLSVASSDGSHRRTIFKPEYLGSSDAMVISDPKFFPSGTEILFGCSVFFPGEEGRMAAWTRNFTKAHAAARRDSPSRTRSGRRVPAARPNARRTAAAPPTRKTSTWVTANCDRNMAAVGDDGSGYRVVLDWPGAEVPGDIHRDGSQIAFTAGADSLGFPSPSIIWTDPDSDPEAPEEYATGTTQIWVLDQATGAVDSLTTPDEWASASEPVFSPDGTRVAFTGLRHDDPDFQKVISQGGDWPDMWIEFMSRVYVMNVDGTDLRRISRSGAGWLSFQPSWTPDGHAVNFAEVPWTATRNTPDWPISISRASQNGGTVTQLIDGEEYADDQLVVTRPTQARSTWDHLLARWAPVLRYDDQEAFRADSAANITDWPGNLLYRHFGQPIGPDTVPLALDLGFLGSPYANGNDAREEDHLDPEGDDGDSPASITAAQTLHADPSYANRVYARSVTDGSGRQWLQYWLWYYGNPKIVDAPGPAEGPGAHEGDWEMVQYRLGTDGATPDLAAYATHDGGRRCEWTGVDKDQTTGAPIVYVALSSHASYFSPGPYVAVDIAGVQVWDHAEGDGDAVQPAIEELNRKTFLSWPGRWGGTADHIPTVGEANSPRGPAFQGTKWTDPGAWANEQPASCEPDQTPARAASQTTSARTTQALGEPTPENLLPPRIKARRRGNRVVITYRVRSRTSMPANLIFSVDRKTERVTPSLKRRPAKTHGKVRLAIPPGRGKLVIRVSAFAADGRKSREATTTLPDRRAIRPARGRDKRK